MRNPTSDLLCCWFPGAAEEAPVHIQALTTSKALKLRANHTGKASSAGYYCWNYHQSVKERSHFVSLQIHSWDKQQVQVPWHFKVPPDRSTCLILCSIPIMDVNHLLLHVILFWIFRSMYQMMGHESFVHMIWSVVRDTVSHSYSTVTYVVVLGQQTWVQ